MVTPPVHCKGSLILGRLGYIEEMFHARWSEYLGALTTETRAAIEGRILKSSWYPFDRFLDVSRTAERLFGAGDYDLCRRMAAHSARVNMPTLYKIFLRFGSPEFMLGKAAQIWQVQYDSGLARSIPRKGGGGGALEVSDFGQPDLLHCNGIVGFIEECLRLVGTKVFTVGHPRCRCRGADVCLWDATWS